MILLCWITVKAFNNPAITSLGDFYDVLVKASQTRNISGNYEGSILSFKSKSSVIFGLVHSFGDFALVIMDTSFWQKGGFFLDLLVLRFAADNSAAMPGYMLGGIAYFAVPWAVGTTAGLAAIGLEDTSIFPTYPRASLDTRESRMTTSEINAGYVLPYTCMAIAGKGGAFGLLLVVFMCVTSTTSAQLIAVSSILSFDVYRTYVNPKASDEQIIRVSHWSVVGFGLFAPAFATALHYGGIDLNWMGYFLATIICPGMFPMAFTILWKKQSTAAAIWSPLLGLASGIGVWLGTAYIYSGELSVVSTEAQLPCLWGALTSTFSSAVYSVAITYIKPQDFDWRIFLLLNQVKDGDLSPTTVNSDQNLTEYRDVRELDSVQHPLPPAELNRLRRAGTIATVASAVIGLVTWVVWPLPLYRNYIFTKSFFMGWTTVSEIWLFFCLCVAVIYPIYDGRLVLSRAARLAWQALFTPSKHAQSLEQSDAQSTTVEMTETTKDG
ncbi:MAG: hypothetical protein M1818_000574 [Claussenomyces sp. TS43310]|nr:MAG: hypothetical protein M1818_000574 [Claussenomyces sp. TS43310]